MPNPEIRDVRRRRAARPNGGQQPVASFGFYRGIFCPFFNRGRGEPDWRRVYSRPARARFSLGVITLQSSDLPLCMIARKGALHSEYGAS